MEKQAWLEMMRNVARALALPDEERIPYLENIYRDQPDILRDALAKLEPPDAHDSFLENPVLGGSSPSIPWDPEAPPNIEPYRVLRKLGEGGMGVVYQVHQKKPKRDLALKVLRAGLGTRDAVSRFSFEYQALAYMDHPHVAHIFESGVAKDGSPYFTMEYFPGAPITTFCEQHRLDARARLALFAKVCAGVHHAHQKGIIHRDLKPSNILVKLQDGEPHPKVIDFGIAKAVGGAPLSERTLFTQLGTILGTPSYMSPEQANQPKEDVDVRSDVYALGAVLYELMTGVPPLAPERFQEITLAERLRIIRDEEPPKPSVRVMREPSRTLLDTRVLQGDLDHIIMKALSKDRDQRYGSVAQLMDDLDRFLSHRPVNAAPPTTFYRLKKFVRRNKTGVTAASLIFVAILTALYGLFQAQQSEIRELTALKRYHAVNQFLLDIFAAPDPKNANKDIRVVDLLKIAVVNLKDYWEVDEATAVSYARALGVLYRDLGLFKEARPLLEEAEKRAGTVLLKRDPEIQDTKMDLAALYMYLNDAHNAEVHYCRTLDIRKDLYGEHNPTTLLALRGLADTLKMQSEKVGAHDIYHDVATMQWRVVERIPEDELDLAGTLMAMANLRKPDDQAEAEHLYREALALRVAFFGEQDAKVLVVKSNLAKLLLEKGSYHEAETHLSEILSIRHQRLGPEHPDTLHIIHSLANLRFRQGRFAEAEDAARRAWQGRRKVLGDEHRGTLASKEIHAMALCALGDPEKAVVSFHEIMDIRNRNEEIPLQDQNNTLENLAECLIQHGLYAEAESQLRDYLGNPEPLGITPRPEEKELYILLLQAFEGQGKSKEAKALKAKLAELEKK